ncbi:MAG: hypothetical protein H7066_17885 [Cytophagaceae bacterium]|nr:hypothetical protein [Gemmatimonadaceae bacterium]
MAEPKTLLVGVSAWRLSHAPASPGQHNAADGCTWAPSTECDFTVEFARDVTASDNDFSPIPLLPAVAEPRARASGAPFAAQFVAEIPLEKAPPIIVRVTAKPTAKLKVKGSIGQPPRSDDIELEAFFPGTAFFVYEGGGFWRRHSRTDEEDEENSAEHFAPPVSLGGTTTEPFVFSLIAFFMARVRNRTRRALDIERALDPGRPEFVKRQDSVTHLAQVPIADRRVQMLTEDVDLDAECRVLEIAGFKAPAAVAVCWPRANDKQTGGAGTPTPRADPMESLVFFHASFGQNAAIYNQTPYPFGLKQIDHGFAGYLNTAAHPLRQPYALSLPWQMAVAGKQAVLVLPLNRVAPPELTNLNNGEQATELLEEIQVSFLRAAGHYFWAPRLGRMAIASFSAAINELHQFFQAINQSPLLRSLHEEIYMFDVRHTNGPECAKYAIGFKSWAGANPVRRVRFYNDDPSPDHASFLGRGALPASPFVLDSADGRFTSAVVTDADWLRSAIGRDHFSFRVNPAVKDATLGIAASVGDTSIVVKGQNPITVGATFVFSKEVYRAVEVNGARVTLNTPVRVAAPVDSGMIVAPPARPRTTLTRPASRGDKILSVASPLGLLEDSSAVIGGELVVSVLDVNAQTIELERAMPRAFPAGATVENAEACIRTFLSADHAPGADTLTVMETTVVGFAVGLEISIGFLEFVKIKAIQGSTLVLERPTTLPHGEGTVVGPVKERKLHFGLYHAMFVSVFLTDAMRKSGFK